MAQNSDATVLTAYIFKTLEISEIGLLVYLLIYFFQLVTRIIQIYKGFSRYGKQTKSPYFLGHSVYISI